MPVSNQDLDFYRPMSWSYFEHWLEVRGTCNFSFYWYCSVARHCLKIQIRTLILRREVVAQFNWYWWNWWLSLFKNTDTVYPNVQFIPVDSTYNIVWSYLISYSWKIYIGSGNVGPSSSWSYGCWIYNYLCSQCLSPLKLWVGISLMARCTRYNIMWYSLSVTCDMPVVFSGFLHQ